ncbi:Inorganic pyrophosphatase [Quillaja saponaria]|uniref:Inorganic pyrophosphatase n=1 Tax=Quillaja saponaria TaxID=32244 RepID=A0AAD7M3U5_QUISA|nr:Inorganic pyrophosphatase [Quillaja saponaria]
MVGIAVVFDFDRTIIDDDSDRWVVTQMGLTQLFNELRFTMPWTSLMDRMMKELHSKGITPKEIAECLKRAQLHPPIIAAIKSAHALGCDLRIISDANLFFIETILEYHGVSSPHGCHLCPLNMCKGLVIDGIRGCPTEKEKKRVIYLGDGKGDFCPTLGLRESDYVMPRKNYPLWNWICSNQTLVKAKVHEWSNGDELESILLNLINKISIEEGSITGNSRLLNSSECEFQPVPLSTDEAF